MALTASRLRELLHYDPDTGAWAWRVRSGGRSTVGSAAGYIDKSTGYRKIRVDGRNYYVHRLAFLYMKGEWPADQVDHVNRARADNRWENLRECDRVTNARNTGVRRRNKLGVKGVLRLPAGNFQARIYRDGQGWHLGCFPTIEAASEAYRRAGGIQ